MSYSIFFQRGDTLTRLPVNPEKLEMSTALANEKYVVLGLGQIVVPTNIELTEYTLSEVEFPYSRRSYSETNGKFQGPDYYANLISVWMDHKDPVRFIARNGITKDINTLVIITECKPSEKAGEEGDKYYDLSLLQYVDFGKKQVVTTTKAGSATKKTITTAKKVPTVARNPKGKPTYTVRRGDTLWAIAKRYYGNGEKYTVIYNANRNKIKNPNLIHSGQVLSIP